MKERIICAAVWFQDGIDTYIHQPKNITSGYVVAGRRHHNCFTTHAMLKGLRSTTSKPISSEQGFITTEDRFVDRKEAYRIAHEAGQVNGQLDKELYSEDLY